MAKRKKSKPKAGKSGANEIGGSLGEWKALYGVMDRFFAQRPWEYFDNLDVFVVQDPNDFEMYLCSVLGAGGQEYGMNVYRGGAGMRNFYTIADGAGERLPREFYYSMDMLSFTLEDKEMLDRRDLAVIKKLLRSYRGGEWPWLRSYRPHFAPWYLEGAEVRALHLCIEQVLAVAAEHEEDTPDYLRQGEEGQILGRCFEDGAWRSRFVAVGYPVKDPAPEVELDDISAQRLASMPTTKGRFEMDLVHMPGLVADGGRPFFPLLVASTDEEGRAAMTDVFPPKGNIYEQAVSEVVTLFDKAGGRPETVALREGTFADVIEPILTNAGIRCICQELQGIDHMLVALDEHMLESASGSGGDDFVS